MRDSLNVHRRRLTDRICSGDFTIGGMVDSYYEYLIKMVALLGNNRGDYAEMFTHAANVSIRMPRQQHG